ncbi:pyruvate formate lyase family protein [Ructibacterium gallinarum]|uniref:4-hydroxyphenylacetate decarboxylase n=1 Tax=Ructibacterium gallinarum TaxID=2779355 RepID=A0A9D5M6Y9_9FIRM|nr:pyruvate formate lyase family protein [Ructibacterium gallinarum]MBE5040684.1 hypothetical protein [Ructibacterium gallinarum]
MSKLDRLKELVFESDNEACFIERERILNRLETEFSDYNEPDRYARIFSELMSEVSVPIYDCDYFAGRVPEAEPDQGMNAPNRLLCSTGHMNFDYETLLNSGLKGILASIKHSAEEKGDTQSKIFAMNAEIVVEAIRNYAARYSAEAKRLGRMEMAKALEVVPYEPAYDFYSALQSIWIIHMIASCYVGNRDYAFGRFDEYMHPFYTHAKENGMSNDKICELLSGFFIKTNEICGRGTWNYKEKPVLCQASKQYINIGGETPNEFSRVVLKAAVMNNMAQPQITVLLKSNADEVFLEEVFKAMSVLTDKLHVYNYNLVLNTLLKKGIPYNVAKEFTYSACCTFDLNYHSYRLEYFVPVLQLFLKILKENEYSNIDDIKRALKTAIRDDIQSDISEKECSFSDMEFARKYFVLDGLFLTDTAEESRYPCDGNSKYVVFNVFCPGIATLGDSLMVLDKLVFREKRYTYADFIGILDSNFENKDELCCEIKSYTKFGNDTDMDEYTAEAGKVFLDAVDMLDLKDNYYVIGGFYSLERENVWKVGATPDGRKDGEVFSENQSPTYGADKNGITALLKSLSKLPFDRTATGGLNITFSRSVSPEILKALTISYFELGGLHIGISVVNSEELKDAMKNPDRYKSLTVRMYGFSEYFISLPKWQQIAIINRTQYKA